MGESHANLYNKRAVFFTSYHAVFPIFRIFGKHITVKHWGVAQCCSMSSAEEPPSQFTSIDHRGDNKPWSANRFKPVVSHFFLKKDRYRPYVLCHAHQFDDEINIFTKLVLFSCKILPFLILRVNRILWNSVKKTLYFYLLSLTSMGTMGDMSLLTFAAHEFSRLLFQAGTHRSNQLSTLLRNSSYVGRTPLCDANVSQLASCNPHPLMGNFRKFFKPWKF